MVSAAVNVEFSHAVDANSGPTIATAIATSVAGPQSRFRHMFSKFDAHRRRVAPNRQPQPDQPDDRPGFREGEHVLHHGTRPHPAHVDQVSSAIETIASRF